MRRPGSAATAGQPERLLLENVQGTLNIAVDPYLVAGVPSTTYTLTATGDVSGDSDGDGSPTVTTCPGAGTDAHGCPDADGDGVADVHDVCPAAGATAPTVPDPGHRARERLRRRRRSPASQDVDTSDGPRHVRDRRHGPAGSHELRSSGRTTARSSRPTYRTVVHTTAGTDRDGDGVADGADNCVQPAQRRPGGPRPGRQG